MRSLAGRLAPSATGQRLRGERTSQTESTSWSTCTESTAPSSRTKKVAPPHTAVGSRWRPMIRSGPVASTRVSIPSGSSARAPIVHGRISAMSARSWASFPHDAGSAEDLMRVADRRLYVGKDRGRDRGPLALRRDDRLDELLGAVLGAAGAPPARAEARGAARSAQVFGPLF